MTEIVILICVIITLVVSLIHLGLKIKWLKRDKKKD